MCTDIVFAIVETIMVQCKHSEIAQLYAEVNDTCDTGDVGDIDLDTKKTIRYIGGAAVAHVAAKLKNEIHHKILKTCYGDRSLYRSHRILNRLRIPESVALSSSSDVATLQETVRRQGIAGGLTHIADQAFHFFCMLYLKIRKWQNTSLLRADPSNVHNVTMMELKGDVDLVAEWVSLLQDLEESHDKASVAGLGCTDDTDSWLKVEMEQAMILNMFDLVVSYVAKTHLSDMLSQCKESMNWKCGKSLRSSMWGAAKEADVIQPAIEYPCGTCGKECIDESDSTVFADYSVLCDTCNKWYHLICVGLTGKESFLKNRSKEPYSCAECTSLIERQGSTPSVQSTNASCKATKRNTASKKCVHSESDNVTESQVGDVSARGRLGKKPQKLDL